MEPEELLRVARDESLPRERRDAAVGDLLAAVQEPLLHGFRRLVPSKRVGSFLSAIGCDSVEGFLGEVFMRSFEGWKEGKNARFTTYLFTAMQNAVFGVFRRQKTRRFETLAGSDDGPGHRPPAKPEADPHVQALVAEVRAQARRCLESLSKRHREAYVAYYVLGLDHDGAAELWPDVSRDGLKKIKERALTAFLDQWKQQGGETLQREIGEAFAAAVAMRVDTTRIRNASALEVYREWMRKRDLAAVAEALGMKPETARKLLLEAMDDLFDQALFRSGRLRTDAVRKHAPELVAYLELADGRAPLGAAASAVRRTLDLVRASFGLAPIADALETLGSALRRRLRSESDYDTACRELRLTPAGLRGLLAGREKPGRPLTRRLSKFLGMPEKRVRALPCAPPDSGAVLRSSSHPSFSPVRFRERVLSCLHK